MLITTSASKTTRCFVVIALGVAAVVSPSMSAIDSLLMYGRVRVIQLSLNSCGHEYSHMAVTCLPVEYIIRRNRCTGRLHC